MGAWLLRRDLNSVLHHIQDPLNRHQVEHPRPVPLKKADSELPEEGQPAIESIRQAQKLLCDLLGLSIKDKTGHQLRHQPIGQTGE